MAWKRSVWRATGGVDDVGVVVATAVATVVVVWELSGWASGSYTRQRGTLVETRFGERSNFMKMLSGP